MTPAERRNRLRHARKIVERVLADMNVKFTNCSCCDHKKYEDWNDFQEAQVLKGICGKLSQWENFHDRLEKATKP